MSRTNKEERRLLPPMISYDAGRMNVSTVDWKGTGIHIYLGSDAPLDFFLLAPNIAFLSVCAFYVLAECLDT